MSLTEAISNIQSRLRYYEALLSLSSTTNVAQTYAATCRAARAEAGAAMTAAWKAKPTTRDRDVSMVDSCETPETTRHLTELVAAMRHASERSE